MGGRKQKRKVFWVQGNQQKGEKVSEPKSRGLAREPK